MPNIYARNVSEALYTGLNLLKSEGIWQKSRSGLVIEYPTPVMTVYTAPQERVLFYPQRDANPFFHLFEAFWMLGGRNDLEFVNRFNRRMKEFSDDGETLNGAYGHRWRNYWKKDQLDLLVDHLQDQPDSRRAVLQMWSTEDLQKIVDEPACKDVPCNTQVYFKIRQECLQMTVTCRSNDIIWGTYGANAVHFSILQEYVAARLGIAIGTYYHLSDSFHAYEKVFNKTCEILEQKDPGDTLWYDSYLGWNKGMHYSPEPIFDRPSFIDDDLYLFLNQPFLSQLQLFDHSIAKAIYRNSFFPETALPMLRAWDAYKRKQYEEAIDYLQNVPALDWQKAAIEWLERRRKQWESKKQ